VLRAARSAPSAVIAQLERSAKIMKAQIRFAKKGEFKGLFAPLVCVFDEKVRFIFVSGSHVIIDVFRSKSFEPKQPLFSNSYIYQISESNSLCITSGSGNWLFNDQCVCEEWPTTHRRQFRCGVHVFDVKPEDDTFSFLVSNDDSDLIKAIIAFYLKLGSPD
jgi:hypothetical protein